MSVEILLQMYSESAEALILLQVGFMLCISYSLDSSYKYLHAILNPHQQRTTLNLPNNSIPCQSPLLRNGPFINLCP